MIAEIHCPCGHREPTKPASLKPQFHCRKCGEVLSFRRPGQKGESVLWLSVGGRKGPARLAAPVPQEMTLKIGAGGKCWLMLPGDDVGDPQVEIRLSPEGRLNVKHVGGDAETWINRARIASGVLTEGDRLRIGPYVLRLRKAESLSLADTSAPEVIVENDDGEIIDVARTDEIEQPEGKPLDRTILDASRPKAYRLKVSVLLVLIVGTAAYFVRAMYWPALSEEMPMETEFVCPADGTKVRAAWADGPPRCPQCGQLCFGSIRYAVEGGTGEGPAAEATRSPASAPSSTPADEPASEGETPATRPADAVGAVVEKEGAP